MKRVNRIWDVLVSDENLTKAVKEVIASHRWYHFPDKPNTTAAWMEKDIKARVKDLKEILTQGFEPGEIKRKRRYDANAGKWRDIAEPPIWPDQCVHHALIQVIQPVMMRGMDHWTCGSIRGRGAHYGIKAIKKWMKGKEVAYCTELDIYHYYDSINPAYVMNRMKQLIKDRKTLDLIWRIIKDGILIGAYCSQWFANTLLQPLDQIIRDNGATHYIRYMDNFTIFTKRKRTARKIIEIIRAWLAKLGLKLKGNYQTFKTKHRMPNALGYRFGKGYTLLRKKSLLRLKKNLRRFYFMRERGRFIPLKFAQGLLSRLGMLRHCNSRKIYARYVKKRTQRHLKDVVRKYLKEALKRWNTYSEPALGVA